MLLSPELFRLIFVYLDSLTLYRLEGVSRWLRACITSSDHVWKQLLTGRFPHLRLNSPSSTDYRAMQRQVDQNQFKILRFGSRHSVELYEHSPDSLLRLPGGFKSIRSIGCGGFFFAIHSVHQHLIVVNDRNRQEILLGIDEYRCGRSCLVYRSGPSWFLRHNVLSVYSSRSDDIPLPDQLRLVACGWETAVVLTHSNHLHIMSRDRPIWSVPFDVDLMGCGEGNVVVVNRTGVYQSGLEQASWDLLHSFDQHQHAIRLKVWFRSIAVQTNRGWLVKLPKSSRMIELPAGVQDVHLGDWHYVYVLADGRIWSGGDHCRGANLGSQDKPEASPVPESTVPAGSVFEYCCGGWQTLVLRLDGNSAH